MPTRRCDWQAPAAQCSQQFHLLFANCTFINSITGPSQRITTSSPTETAQACILHLHMGHARARSHAQRRININSATLQDWYSLGQPRFAPRHRRSVISHTSESGSCFACSQASLLMPLPTSASYTLRAVCLFGFIHHCWLHVGDVYTFFCGY